MNINFDFQRSQADRLEREADNLAQIADNEGLPIGNNDVPGTDTPVLGSPAGNWLPEPQPVTRIAPPLRAALDDAFLAEQMAIGGEDREDSGWKSFQQLGWDLGAMGRRGRHRHLCRPAVLPSRSRRG